MKKMTVLMLTVFLTVPYLFAETPAGLEEVIFMDIPSVITPTMTEKTSEKAPASVTVVTENDIKASGARSLPEVLERLTGIHVFDSYDGRALTNVRGILTEANDKIKLLIDGHSIIEPVWNNAFDMYVPPIENIKQIEIVRGPGSSLYGTGAFSATINIITKKPRDVYGLTVDQKYGSFDSWTTNAAYGARKGKYEFGVNYNSYQSKGPDLKIDHDWLSGQGALGLGTSIAPGVMTESRRRHQADMYVGCGGLSFQGLFADSVVDFPLDEMATLTENGEKQYFTYGFGEIKYETAVTERLKVRVKTSYDHMRMNLKGQALPNNFSLAGGIDLNGDGIPELWADGLLSDYRYTSEQYKSEAIADYMLTDANELLGGIFYEDIRLVDPQYKSNMIGLSFMNAGSVMDFTGTEFNWLTPRERSVHGAFFQDEWTLTADHYLIIGGRYDKYNDVGESFNPRCGYVWQYLRDETMTGNVKFLYGTAFRAPSFGQLYMLSVGYTGIKPENIQSGEVVFANTIMGKVDTTVSFFHQKTDNLTIRDVNTSANGIISWINHGKTTAGGVEMSGKYYFLPKQYVYVGYANTLATSDETGEDLPFTARNQAEAGLNMKLPHKLNWNVNADYTSELTREPGDHRPPVGADIVTNTTLSVENYAGFDFYVSVYDVFDRAVRAPSFVGIMPVEDIPRPGRQYSCGVTYRF